MKEIPQRSSVTDAQLDVSFKLDGDFYDNFSKIFDTAPVRSHQQTTILKAAWIDTVLGPMIAIADEDALYLLEFVTRRGLEKEVKRLHSRGFTIVSGSTAPIESIRHEIAAYFAGTLMQFSTPYRVLGSLFQQQVWNALCKIPYGETRSYKEQAISLGKSSAFRAVANANGMNQLAIMIPCHRVIASDGTLGGYGGGLAIKQWLLDHEMHVWGQGLI